MKILFVVTDMNMGGISTSLLNFTDDFVKRENSVYVLNMGEKTELENNFNSKVQQVRLTGKSKYWCLGNKDLKNTKGIKKVFLSILGVIKKITNKHGLWNRLIFKKFNDYGEFDVAIAFRQCSPCYSFVLSKVKAKTKIGFVHGDVHYMGGNEKSFIKYMPKFNKIAYVSNTVKDGFIEKYPVLKQNAVTIYNMFNKGQILEKAKEYNPFVFDKSVKNIVTVARHDNEFKRIDWIPQICKKLKELNAPSFHWYVVGGGEDFEYNKSLIEKFSVEDVLTFTGNQLNPFAIEKDADFTVLLSTSEAYAMVLIESFILKKPVVITNFTSAKEVVTNGKNGLIAGNDIDDVTQNIKEMLCDKNGVYTCVKDNLEKYECSTDLSYGQFLEAIGGDNNV